MNNNLWFIQRSAKSNFSISDVSQQPEKYLQPLMRGSVSISGKMDPLDTRDYYVSQENKEQRGAIAYKITIVLPDDMLKKLEDSTLLRHSVMNNVLENIGNWGNSMATIQVLLSSINSGGDYPNLYIGDKDLLTLLKHTVIYGGEVNEDGKLIVIYQGEEGKRLLDAYKQTTEGQNQSSEKK